MKRSKNIRECVLFLLTLSMITLSLSSLSIQPASAQGLKVSPVNPRYFTDGSGKAVFLTGSHTWGNLQDLPFPGQTPTDPPPVFDYTAFLDRLEGYGHNFFRLWAWEHAKWMEEVAGDIWITPHPYSRPGPGTALDGKPKWDLSMFSQGYFDRMRSRIIEAGNRGMYVSVMLFNGFSTDEKGVGSGNPWPGHPMHSSNNINGINGDTNRDGYGTETHQSSIAAVTALQEAYVKKVIDTVNDLDNVLYEICNECDSGSTKWQKRMIDYIHSYEATLPKQHPVGFTVQYPAGSNSPLFASNADWISPNSTGGYDTAPPASNGSKVIISDTDHLWGIGGNRAWAWKSFTRGIQPIFMDDYSSTSDFNSLRLSLGYIRSYADKINLLAMTPQPSLCSTKYCLASKKEYMVYAPSGGTISVNLNNTSGDVAVEWFDPSNGNTHSAGVVTGGRTLTFTPPFGGDAVLYLRRFNATLLLGPNGGETVPAGQKDYPITWEAPSDNVSFTLMYSVDGGFNWQTIDTGILGRTYAWAVPTFAKNKANSVIKIIAFDGSHNKVGSDKSDGPFTIEVLTITDINGGFPCTGGQACPITWRISNALAPDELRLAYTFDGGVTWKKEPAITLPAGSTYNWIAPSVKRNKTCRVKLTLKTSAGVTVATAKSGKFKINKP